jgi:hypothetical protein
MRNAGDEAQRGKHVKPRIHAGDDRQPGARLDREVHLLQLICVLAIVGEQGVDDGHD